jgi:carbonic anhydrase
MGIRRRPRARALWSGERRLVAAVGVGEGSRWSPGARRARIVSNVKALPASGDEAERVHQAVEANVRRSVQQLRDAAMLKEKIGRGEIRVVGAVYELDSARVRWLSD